MSVEVTHDAGVALVTMESENNLNVADVPMMNNLRDELQKLADDKATRAVVLTGGGALCAGYMIDDSDR